MSMDWGVHLPHLGRNVGREPLMQFAREIDRLGVHSGWVSDHICWPAEIESKYPYTADGSFAPAPDMGWLDPLSTLTFVAACTDNLRLGVTVLILPYRQPVMTAKQLATLDVLSQGRVILGAGIGWMREEAEILGMPWDHRGARTDEQLELFNLLWTEAEPEFHGRFYELPKVGFEPKPIQSPLPVWIGGASPAAFRRVARFGHAFHAAFQPLEVVAREWADVRAACEAIDRDPDELTLSLRVYLDPDQAMETDKSIGGSEQQMLDTIGAMAEVGISHVLLDPVARGGVPGRLDAVRAFMTDVAPGAR